MIISSQTDSRDLCRLNQLQLEDFPSLSAGPPVAKNCIVTSSGGKIMLINKNVEGLFAKFQERSLTRQGGEH